MHCGRSGEGESGETSRARCGGREEERAGCPARSHLVCVKPSLARGGGQGEERTGASCEESRRGQPHQRQLASCPAGEWRGIWQRRRR